MWRMSEPTEVISSEPTRAAKAPTDVLRLAVAVVSLLVVVVIGALFDEAIVGFVADLIRGIEALPTWLVTGLVLFGQVLGVVVIVGGAVMAVVRRRWLLLAITAAAAGGRGAAHPADPPDRRPLRAAGGRCGRVVHAGPRAIGSPRRWAWRSWRRS